jgi:hypothetical protein
MTNVLVLGIVGAFIILIIAAYIQSKKTREELIAEIKDEVAPVVAPAPVEAKVKPTVATVKEIPALVEALAAKAVVQEMVATQEAPAPKPKNNRRRGRPGKKQETNSTK